MGARYAFEPRDPGYGVPVDDGLPATRADVGVDVEVAAARWAPVDPAPGASPASVLFLDGVSRVDGTVWVIGEDGRSRPALAASVAAGAVRCAGPRATVVARAQGRVLVTASPDAAELATAHGPYRLRTAPADGQEVLWAEVIAAMAELEVRLAREHAVEAELVVADGRLRHPGGHPPRTVGYVKSHGATYLPDEVEPVVGRLAPGQRTPLFCIPHPMGSRLSWYVRLPGGSGHPWAGVARCEVTGDTAPAAAVELADATCRCLPAFASAAHKDPRAPVNLQPIGGLERDLRHHLGDPAVLERALRLAVA